MTSPDRPHQATRSSGVETVVVFHAHPDDEAIFTGGTLRLLADGGVRTVVAFATDGALGIAPDGTGPGRVGEIRRSEAGDAARLLGVDRIVWLGFGDSGMTVDDASRGERRPDHRPLIEVPDAEVADALRRVLVAEGARTLIGYDPHGIYGHPDHLVVHRAACLAVEGTEVATRYEATVDREHLHFVATHLVSDARRAGLRAADPTLDAMSVDLRTFAIPEASPTGADGPGRHAETPPAAGFGVPSVMVDVAIDVRSVITTKRDAMAAHASQIPADSPTLAFDAAVFGEVYGTEWFLRHGLPGPLDALPRR